MNLTQPQQLIDRTYHNHKGAENIANPIIYVNGSQYRIENSCPTSFYPACQ